MAAGDSNIVEIGNAGNQPKQRKMAEDWDKMNSEYKSARKTARDTRNTAITTAKGDRDTAISNAKTVRDEAIEKARADLKLAKQQRDMAYISGDQAAALAANKAINDAEAAKEQAITAYENTKSKVKEAYKNTKVQANAAYGEASNIAKGQYKLTHDSLRSAEKEHNNISADATMNLNKDLTDIQKEQTEELSKQFSNNNGQPGTDNNQPGTDNNQPGTDNNQPGTDNNQPGPDNNGKNMTKNKKGGNFQFSQSFYDTLGNAIKGQPQGNLADVKSKGAKEQAQNLRNAAATNQMEAQRAQQIANQNPYSEAGKMASMQNDAENRQNVQKAGVLGAGAALARRTNAPDVKSQMQRQDQQQEVANQRREEEQANQQEATELGNLSEQKQLESRDYTEFKDKAAALSKGEPAKPEQKPAEQPKPAEPA